MVHDTRPYRLAHLNKLYTAIYPDLPYITFVAGRPRSAIVTEMEDRLGLERTPIPLTDDSDVERLLEQPEIDSPEVRTKVVKKDDQAWSNELERAVEDVWRIAQARTVSSI